MKNNFQQMINSKHPILHRKQSSDFAFGRSMHQKLPPHEPRLRENRAKTIIIIRNPLFSSFSIPFAHPSSHDIFRLTRIIKSSRALLSLSRSARQFSTRTWPPTRRVGIAAALKARMRAIKNYIRVLSRARPGRRFFSK